MKKIFYNLGQILLNIFARIWALWGLISFVSTFLIIIIPALLTYFVSDPKGQTLFIKIAKIWMDIWLLLILCPLKVKGKEHFANGETYIITFNHNTLLDVPITCPYIPGDNKTIAKKSFVYVPLFGWIYQFASVIVDRKSNESRRKSYEEMKRVLDNGLDMLIYPEGTRNKTKNPLKSFYDGAFRLSVDTGKPIVPVVILNTKRILPAKPLLYLRPGNIILNILPAISPIGHSTESLKNLVFEIMADHYEKNNKN